MSSTKAGQSAPLPSRCQRTHSIAGAPESEPVVLAGRVQSDRLTDESGSITLLIQTQEPPGPNDIIEVHGTITCDDDTRYFSVTRWRCLVPSGGPAVDVKVSPENLVLRSRLLRGIRNFFEAKHFLEVETPTLFSASTFNPHIEEFKTRFEDEVGNQDLFLQTSPEHYMKRLLVTGSERIYQIGRFFRNGEITSHHNPEFTGLEFYEAYCDYNRIMETTESLIAGLALELLGSHTLQTETGEIDFKPPWPRLTIAEAFHQYANMDLTPCHDTPSMKQAAQNAGIQTAADDAYDDIFFRVFLERIEPHMGVHQPTFLLDYPIQMAIMAKACEKDPQWAQRVELYVGGIELANGFTEENNHEEQRRRFHVEQERRQQQSPGAQEPLDENFLAALAHGMPPSAGIAIGLDRLLMLLAKASSIQEVIAFPHQAPASTMVSNLDTQAG